MHSKVNGQVMTGVEITVSRRVSGVRRGRQDEGIEDGGIEDGAPLQL